MTAPAPPSAPAVVPGGVPGSILALLSAKAAGHPAGGEVSLVAAGSVDFSLLLQRSAVGHSTTGPMRPAVPAAPAPAEGTGSAPADAAPARDEQERAAAVWLPIPVVLPEPTAALAEPATPDTPAERTLESDIAVAAPARQPMPPAAGEGRRTPTPPVVIAATEPVAQATTDPCSEPVGPVAASVPRTDLAKPMAATEPIPPASAVKLPDAASPGEAMLPDEGTAEPADPADQGKPQPAAARFAAAPSATGAGEGERRPPAEKLFLKPTEQRVADTPESAGIAAAHGGIAMRTKPTITDGTEAVLSVDRGFLAAERGSAPIAIEPPQPAVPRAEVLRPQAQQALAAVLRVVETQASHGSERPNRVDLRVDLGDEQLVVRVELRGDDVHTSFRTDSAGLRAALREEWPALASDQTGRTWRLLEPQFAGVRGGGDFNGQPGGHPGGQSGRERPELPGPPAWLRSQPAAAGAPAPAVPATNAHSLHLAALA